MNASINSTTSEALTGLHPVNDSLRDLTLNLLTISHHPTNHRPNLVLQICRAVRAIGTQLITWFRCDVIISTWAVSCALIE